MMGFFRKTRKQTPDEVELKRLADAEKASIAKRLRFVQLEVDVIRRQVEGLNQ